MTILNLDPAQFRAALAELQLDPQREAALRRQYREANSPLAGLYGLLDRAGQGEEGMEAATLLPVSRPEGMSVADAIRSGEAGFAVPQGLLDAVGGAARALDAPSAAAAGLIPRDDMIGEAIGTAGVAMGAGGLLTRPDGSVGMGGRIAGDTTESPAQRVARLLREGRADEVTDDLMAQADPQEMYRLYEAGETGMDLPMDEASRMARAGEMGFDTALPLYHGTGADFQAFDTARFQQSDFGTGGAGVYSSESPSLAGAYADLVTRPSNDNANILPIVTRRQDAYDNGGYRNINNYEQAREYSQRMQNLGVDNVYYRDNISGEIVENVTFDPRNIRSRFARFDPRLSNLSNLNAANVDPLTGAAAVTASQQDDPLANLRAYISAAGGILPR